MAHWGAHRVLAQASRSGEIRLLAPALGSLKAPAALVESPCDPCVEGLAYSGIPAEQVLLLRAKRSNDQLWSAEQILKASTCGAVLLWQTHVRADSLRRLLLAARSSTSLLFVFRPILSASDASPAELRVAVRPAELTNVTSCLATDYSVRNTRGLIFETDKAHQRLRR